MYAEFQAFDDSCYLDFTICDDFVGTTNTIAPAAGIDFVEDDDVNMESTAQTLNSRPYSASSMVKDTQPLNSRPYSSVKDSKRKKSKASVSRM